MGDKKLQGKGNKATRSAQSFGGNVKVTKEEKKLWERRGWS
jgi:hypothetical protein